MPYKRPGDDSPVCSRSPRAKRVRIVTEKARYGMESAVKKAISFLSPRKSPKKAAQNSLKCIPTAESMPSLLAPSDCGKSIADDDASSFAFDDAASIEAPSISTTASGLPPLVASDDEDDDDFLYQPLNEDEVNDEPMDVDDELEAVTEKEPDDEAPVTDAQELENMRKKFRSPIYAFFLGDIKIEYRKGKKHHVFSCGARGCNYKYSRNLESKDRTSSKMLHEHAKKCWGEATVKAALETEDLNKAKDIVKKMGNKKNGRLTDAFLKIKRFGRELFSHVPMTKPETRAACVQWCAESLRPFNVVKDTGFERLMKTGRPSTYIPHPTTVSRDTKVLFAKTRRRFAKKLKNYPGRISIATDAWTSPNHRAFVAYTAHYEDNGDRVSTLLDFRELPKSHTGEELAKLTEEVIREFGLEDKILSITCDNAANNDVMVVALGDSAGVPGFEGQPARTRCFAHIINLVAKSLLRLFDGKAKAKGADNEVGDEDVDEELDIETLLTQLQELEASTPERDDPDDFFDELDEMGSEEKRAFLAETKAISKALKKIRTISTKILQSTTILLPKWNDRCKENKLAQRRMLRDVATRWNSTYDMITFAVEYKRAVRDMTDLDQLADYRLTAVEWETLQNLRDVLQAFKDATLFFSRSSTTLASVIPAMDKLDNILATAVIRRRDGPDTTLSTPVKAALLVAKKTLNRYYSLTDDSNVYRLALMLHPRRKLEYFEEQNWLPEWMDNVRRLLETTFGEYRDAYEMEIGEVEEGLSPVAEKSAPRSSSNMFDDMEDLPLSKNRLPHCRRDELREYLAKPCENPPNGDVVSYWISRQANWPVLSRMALDYLVIPPTSVDVERVFSRGRLLITHIRNRLSAQTARALLCLGDWSRLGMVYAGDFETVTALPLVAETEGDEMGDVLLPDDYADIPKS